jgi:endonuclease-3
MSSLPVVSTIEERKYRAKKILAYLKKVYPEPKTELHYKTPMQMVAAVMMSAQCTDKKVNQVTSTLYKKYKTINDFADANLAEFTDEISSVTFYRNKAKAIVATAV